MSEPKLLSPEELDTVRDVAETQVEAKWSQTAVLKLLAHIAALEADRNEWKRRAESLLSQAEALEADNAALLRVIVNAGERLRAKRPPNAIFVATSMVGDVQCANGHPGAALLEEHRKALVRARNEGLEKAKEAVRHALTAGLLTPGNVTQALREINAMKEPEK